MEIVVTLDADKFARSPKDFYSIRELMISAGIDPRYHYDAWFEAETCNTKIRGTALEPPKPMESSDPVTNHEVKEVMQ